MATGAIQCNPVQRCDDERNEEANDDFSRVFRSYRQGSGPVNPSPNWPRSVTGTGSQEREGICEKMEVVDIPFNHSYQGKPHLNK